jgi:hypothetical protein
VTPERLHQHLEELLARLGVDVRSESFDPKMFHDTSTRGGLCRLRNRTVVLVDSRAPLVERIAVLATAAASLDTESVYVPPAVREVIETHGIRPTPVVGKAPLLRLVRLDDRRKRR